MQRFDVVDVRYYARPSIPDFASPCPSERGVYLRKVLRIRVDAPIPALGRLVYVGLLHPFRINGRGLERQELTSPS